jgi:aminoglycoside 6'-N-acetyltransferase I
VSRPIVTRACAADREDWLDMRMQLWPGVARGEFAQDIDAFLAARRTPAAWIARTDDGRPMGFAETDVRSYAEGCQGPAPYLEGIWVEPEWRRSGVASALLRAVERWARDLGFTELGSNALINNTQSHGWHRESGFAEVERLVVFRKPL